MLSLLATLLVAPVLQDAAPDADTQVTVYKAAKVYTADPDVGMVNNGLVVVQDGKIAWAGPASGVEIEEGVEVVDLGRVWLVPGFLDPHNHVAGSLSDLNDNVYLTNPEFRTVDLLEPQNPLLLDSVAGGVTTALLIPGSGSNMGGFGMVVKTSSKSIEDMIVRSPGSLKVAQSGNPERYSWGVRRAMMNWNTRNTLREGLEWAKAYKAGEAPFDPRYEGFIGLETGTVHTQGMQVVMQTLVMQVQELGLKSFVDHGTFDGYLNAPLAAELGVPVMNGPRHYFLDRATGQIFGTAARWLEADVVLGYNTDSPVVPQEELPLQAAMGLRFGAGDLQDGIDGLTRNVALAMLVDDVCGSLMVGKDADFVAWDGDPIDPRSSVQKVWVRGEQVYDIAEGRRRF